ncbi:PP2C family protein-serine/threonine phosphatase [Yoonia litorea]|uniref:Serine/threonine protein phosphatase PrpC n=1 Tax=Yoonia litorea TaxID=1123755 RepID=A0A1I6MI86_9RHOB|nr:protein phosphatase 2C domain-containing protein [Yoonia litorea]SFS15328.1 Serine/threonine protein phosphatase PrpC [Yoonia litorea]
MMSKTLAFRRRPEPVASFTGRPIKDRFDVASAIDIGCRLYQQDALISNFVNGDDVGIAVLADGMGGHVGGEIASNIASSTAFAVAKTSLIASRLEQEAIPSSLGAAVDRANAALGEKIARDPQLKGMGTTLVVVATIGPNLYWASVGDSPLYRYRDGQLKQLNHNHSMAAQIDAMVASGIMDAEQGRNHPQRHELTAAVCGNEIARRHCPEKPVTLTAGDILVLASDGIQTLQDESIRSTIYRNRKSSADDITKALLQSVHAVQDPEQDNVSILVIKVASDAPAQVVRPPDNEPVLVQTRAPKDEDRDVETASDLLNQALEL